MPQVLGTEITLAAEALGKLETGICHSGGIREATSESLRSRMYCHWCSGIVGGVMKVCGFSWREESFCLELSKLCLRSLI